GTATATILNNLTTSRNYTLPNKSGTFALTTDIPTLQQVVDTGNTIVTPTTVSKGIDITLAGLGTVYQNGVLVTIPNQTGSNASPDAYVAKINGQSPGTLNGFTGGFVVDAHGLDNVGFIADLQSDSGTSAGCVMKSFDSHVGDLFRGVKRIGAAESTVFQVANNGDVKANTLSVYDSPNGAYSKIAINDSYFTISRPQGAFTPMLSIEDGANLILTNDSGAAAQILNNLLVSRNYTLPNASGTFALTSDITVPTLQQVTEAGLYAESGEAETINISNVAGGIGVLVTSEDGNAIIATSVAADAIVGNSTDSTGVFGTSIYGFGVRGISTDGIGGYFTSQENVGVSGASSVSAGGNFYSSEAPGIQAISADGVGGFFSSSTAYSLVAAQSAAKPGGGSWSVYSDSRIKENIVPYTKGLADILLINTVTYEYNGLAGTTKGAKFTGIIAQEIKEIFPETVNTYKAKLNEEDKEKTELYDFNSSDLTFALINAVKELKAEIEILKAEVEILKAK
ncbi:MAG: tail fiber domain-containing protein, partial [Candidatus Fonsibacter sp.]